VVVNIYLKLNEQVPLPERQRNESNKKPGKFLPYRFSDIVKFATK